MDEQTRILLDRLFDKIERLDKDIIQLREHVRKHEIEFPDRLTRLENNGQPESVKQKLHELGDDKENPRYQNENFKKVEEQKPDWLINIFKSKHGISVVCNETLASSFTPTEKWTIKHGLLQFINESLNDAKP